MSSISCVAPALLVLGFCDSIFNSGAAFFFGGSSELADGDLDLVGVVEGEFDADESSLSIFNCLGNLLILK
jgi:hypothetical protein